jgi:hypothetical protein
MFSRFRNRNRNRNRNRRREPRRLPRRLARKEWQTVGKACIHDVLDFSVVGVTRLWANKDGYYRVGQVLFPPKIWHNGEKRTCGPGLQAMRVDTCEPCRGRDNWLQGADF